MPTGKQLSFRLGEVSPSLRYKSGAISYQEGLYKARNGEVRKEGGFRNRQGFSFIAQHPQQNLIPSLGENPRARLHRLVNPVDGSDCFVSILADGATFYTNLYDVNGNLLDTDSSGNIFGEEVIFSNLVQGQDLTLITFGVKSDPRFRYMMSLSFPTATTILAGQLEYQAIATDRATATYTFVNLFGSLPNDIPVNWLITEVSDDNEERFIGELSSNNGHPHQYLAAQFSISGLNSWASRKYYNVYRAAETRGFYGLVGRFVPTSATHQYYDYLTVPDFSKAPPQEMRLFGGGSGNWFDIVGTSLSINRVSRAMFYQQRLHISYKDSSPMPEGAIGASKLGVPSSFMTPRVADSINAFEYNIPSSKKDILHLISSNRPFAFTAEGVWMMRGTGEQGVITSTDINPVQVSSIGCSETVSPVEVSGTIYYISSEGNRIIGIRADISGRYEVFELAISSSHLIRRYDIVRMVYLSGNEDTLYVLRRDGKLVSITINDGVAGASLIDFDGRIEDIEGVVRPYKYWESGDFDTGTNEMEFYKKPRQELAILAIRNGVRYLLSMNPRNDIHDEGFDFADMSVPFGTRLSLSQLGEYIAVNSDGTFSRIEPINIEDAGTGYGANETVNLVTANALSLGGAPYIDFYYNDENDIKRTLRFNVVSQSGAGPYTTAGYFDQDVPAQLQDVTTQNPDNKLALQTRWVIPVNQVTGLTHLASEQVSIFADGEVVSSPLSNDETIDTVTVTAGGVADLPEYYGYGMIGLPYEFEMETLDLEPDDGRTFTHEKVSISEIGIALDESRRGAMSQTTTGGEIEKMETIPYQGDNDMDAPPKNFSGHLYRPVQGSWSDERRVLIKQVDPLPITVLSVYPRGMAGG